MRIVIIIPTYNEADNIVKQINLIRNVIEKVKNHKIDIMVCDGNSPDKTYDVVKSTFENIENISAVKEQKKLGLGSAYNYAMDIAFHTMRADAVMALDADLSHDQSKIPLFIEAIEEGYDMAIGTRYKPGGGIPDDWGLHRKLLSIVGNKFVSFLFMGYPLSDFTSGFKILTRNVYNVICDDMSKHNGYTLALYINVIPMLKGFKIKEIPYKFKERIHGKSKLGYEYVLNGSKFILETRIRTFMNVRFIKVFFAGGLGSIGQLFAYIVIFKLFIENLNVFNLPYSFLFNGLVVYPRFFTAQLFSIEVGLLITFYVNNIWAFKDRKLSGYVFFRRYVKVHFVALGAIVIQLSVSQMLALVFGRGYFVDLFYQIVGILLGLIWNYYFYKKIIWKVF